MNGGSPLAQQYSSINVVDDIIFLQDISASLSFGSTYRGILPPTGLQKALMFTSASCSASPPDYFPATNCTTFAAGIMSNGIQSAILAAIEFMRDNFKASLQENVTQYESIASIIFSSDFQNLITMQETYLNDLSDYSRKLALSEVRF